MKQNTVTNPTRGTISDRSDQCRISAGEQNCCTGTKPLAPIPEQLANCRGALIKLNDAIQCLEVATQGISKIDPPTPDESFEEAQRPAGILGDVIAIRDEIATAAVRIDNMRSHLLI